MVAKSATASAGTPDLAATAAGAGVQVDLSAVTAAAAQGAAQGAEIANHLGLSDQQFERLVVLTTGAASQAAAKVAHDVHQQRRRADRMKEHATTAGISAIVFVAGTAAVAGYQKYRNNSNNNGDNRGRAEG